MTEHPVILTGPEILAIQAGNKTQLRFPAWPQPEDLSDLVPKDPCQMGWDYPALGPPGTLLWIQEAWRPIPLKCSDGIIREGVKYSADKSVKVKRPVPNGVLTDIFNVAPEHQSGPYWPPQLMPRWASRTVLKVAEVRVGRLQEISEDDVKAEGVIFDGTYWLGGIHPVKGTFKCLPTPEKAFQASWNATYTNATGPTQLPTGEIIGKPQSIGWDSNPWVWVYEFEGTE